RDQVADGGHDVVVHEGGLREDVAAVHHPVADGGDARLRDRPSDLLEQAPEDGQRLAVVRHGDVALDRLAVRLLRDRPLGLADALDDARDLHVAGRGVEELVLQRRRAGVEDQDGAHAVASSPCAWMAVIATVFTMSSTSAPRDRSLTGLFRPCSTGPTATAPAERCTALYVLLPVLRSGNTNTVARPATSDPGSLDAATEASTAASYWMGPSTSSSGARSRTKPVAVRTLSTSAPEPDSPVE